VSASLLGDGSEQLVRCSARVHCRDGEARQGEDCCQSLPTLLTSEPGEVCAHTSEAGAFVLTTAFIDNDRDGLPDLADPCAVPERDAARSCAARAQLVR
jgi:hypothetical protein